jgi:YcxB-like protein
MTQEVALLEVDVQLEFADYLRYQYFDSLRRLWWLIPIFLLFSAISGIVILVSAFYQDSYMLRDVIPFASLVLFGGIFLFANPYLTAKREFEVNPGLRQVIRYRIFESHLATTSIRREGKLSWAKVREARETGSAFLLYVVGSGAFILPKHEFPSQAEVMSMRELLTVILGPVRCRFHLGRISSRF